MDPQPNPPQPLARGLSVRAKILAVFLLLAVITAAILLGVMHANRQVQRITRRMVNHNLAAVKILKDMETLLVEEDHAVGRYLLTGDAAWLERRQERQGRLRQALTAAGDLAETDMERRLLQEIEAFLPHYRDEVQRLLEEVPALAVGDDARNRMRRDNSVLPDIVRRCEALLGIHEGLLYASREEAEAVASRYRGLGFLTLAMVGASALFLGLLLRRSVLLPIRRLAEGCRAYEQGHLEHRVPVMGNDELGSLSRTFNEMASALQRERGRLTEMSVTDELTQLRNFRHFAARLEEEVRRAERYGHQLSLILFDIDHFKHYNDANGHPAGNEVLRVLGRLLKDNARGTDILARYGGEEFAAILPETGKADAIGLAEKIRRIIELHSFPGEESQPGGGLTVSGGVASVPEDSADSPLLLDAADRALYAAKHAGRNRIVAYRSGMAHPIRDRKPGRRRRAPAGGRAGGG